MNNKETFEASARKYIKRDGIETLLSMIATTDFYTAPASTKFHDSEEGGLVKHSLAVAKYIFKDTDSLQTSPDESAINSESLAIVSLFHDICKIGFYTIEMRNSKDESGKWIKVPYYSVDDKFPMGHGEKSVIMLQQFIQLYPDEMLAIRWHMGGFEPKENYQYLSVAYSQCPLALYLHIADMKATYLSEK